MKLIETQIKLIEYQGKYIETQVNKEAQEKYTQTDEIPLLDDEGWDESWDISYMKSSSQWLTIPLCSRRPRFGKCRGNHGNLWAREISDTYLSKSGPLQVVPLESVRLDWNAEDMNSSLNDTKSKYRKKLF